MEVTFEVGEYILVTAGEYSSYGEVVFVARVEKPFAVNDFRDRKRPRYSLGSGQGLDTQRLLNEGYLTKLTTREFNLDYD
mgnify:CR=1 FL=1